MKITLGDMILGKLPAKITNIAGKKKGRGRPRKVVPVEGIYIHKEPESSGHKTLTPKVRHDVRQRYSELKWTKPGIGLADATQFLSEEFKLQYSQIYQLIV